MRFIFIHFFLIKSIIIKIKVFTSSLKSKEKESFIVNEEVTKNEASDKKKKQISMLLRVFMILGVGYLGVDYYITSNKESIPEIVNIPRKTRKSPKKIMSIPLKSEKLTENTVVAPSPAIEKTEEKILKTKEDTLSAVETFPANGPSVGLPEEHKTVDVQETPAVQAPIENINLADKEAKEIPVASTPVIPTAMKELPVENANPGVKKIDQNIDSLIDEIDKVNKPEVTSLKKVKLEDKIVEDDVYTPPAPYDQLGRGLVYNCKEKYWACIDKAAYINCNKNMKWNKSHGKPSECSVQSVYNSDDDCNIVQKYNISTSKEASTCN